MGYGRIPFTNVRIVIRAGLRSIYQRWHKGQSWPPKRKSVKNRVQFEEAVGFLTLAVTLVLPRVGKRRVGPPKKGTEVSLSVSLVAKCREKLSI